MTMRKKIILLAVVLGAAVTFYGCEKGNEDDGGSDQCGGKKSKGVYAEFSYVISDTEPGKVTFINTSEGDNFSWNFGDNTTSSQVVPEHTYSSTGNFTVSLTASGQNGESDTQTKTLEIRPF
jgi:PKD repeat protein